MKYIARILVVDDEVTVSNLIAAALEEKDYKVDTVHSGEEALKIEAENDYAVILMDMMLPGLNGIDVLERIKKKNPDVTIIMITGNPTIKTAVKSIRLGAFDYLPKPFTPADLIFMVERALETRLAYEEMAAKVGIVERKLVNVFIPNQLYCIPEHSWAKPEPNGNIRIGIHHVPLRIIKEIQSIEFPGIGSIKYQGEVCATIKSYGDKTFRLWTPLSGTIREINPDALTDVSKVIHEPYEDGWLLIIEPLQLDEEIANLQPLKHN
jgi:CheY-like chemotaxis protein/glycine cleavage system H lipoate-binding protein